MPAYNNSGAMLTGVATKKSHQARDTDEKTSTDRQDVTAAVPHPELRRARGDDDSGLGEELAQENSPKTREELAKSRVSSGNGAGSVGRSSQDAEPELSRGG
jgi:hypothetical protein